MKKSLLVIQGSTFILVQCYVKSLCFQWDWGFFMSFVYISVMHNNSSFRKYFCIIWMYVRLLAVHFSQSKLSYDLGLWCLMPLSTIFQYIVVVSLLVEETSVPGEFHWLVGSNKLSHIISYQVHLSTARDQTHNVSGNIGTDCTGSCKSSYHKITSMI